MLNFTPDLADTGIAYHRVVLGWHTEGGSSRWLSDDEICDGIRQVFESANEQSVIGVIEPPESRPK